MNKRWSPPFAGFEERLRQALKLEIPYADRDSSGAKFPGRKATSKPAAVLALFAPGEDGEPALLMTQRTESVETHKGQMAFPGGMCEPEDGTAVSSALRETKEEVGIAPELVRVQGELPGLWTVTDFWVTPVVATSEVPVSRIALEPNAQEIAAAFWIPLSLLLAPETYRLEQREYRGVQYPIHVYQVGPHRIWGATGSMIKNLLDRLRTLG